jgi:hypothetical protein
MAVISRLARQPCFATTAHPAILFYLSRLYHHPSRTTSVSVSQGRTRFQQACVALEGICDELSLGRSTASPNESRVGASLALVADERTLHAGKRWWRTCTRTAVCLCKRRMRMATQRLPNRCGEHAIAVANVKLNVMEATRAGRAKRLPYGVHTFSHRRRKDQKALGVQESCMRYAK